MEEEGTEILLHPGTETVLRQNGSGEEVNLLHYCTTEETEEREPESHEEGMEIEERETTNFNRAFFPPSTRANPASQREPNRYDSLVEDYDSEFADRDDTNKETPLDKFHPALKAALYTEGQEAVWHEDQYTAVSSIYIKPEKKEPVQESKTRMKVPFFKSLAKKQKATRNVEPTPQPVKIHVKKQKVAKAVLLLPPKELGRGTIQEHASIDERLMRENNRHAAITENSVLARRLLDTALSGEGIDEEESQRLAKKAFAYASNARKIALIGRADATMVANEEAIELENALSYLSEEGEHAAAQHFRQQEEENSDDDNYSEDEIYANEADYSEEKSAFTNKVRRKRGGKPIATGYASRAVQYLENILPKHPTDNLFDGINENNVKLSAPEDFWSDAGISTLGLKNDTLEYGFSKDEGDTDPNCRGEHDQAGLRRNGDMMSLSSLNEILDGGSKVTEKRSLKNEDGSRDQESSRSEVSSPRTAVREIGIPRKEKSIRPSTTRARRSRGGILGLVTPRTTRSNKRESTKHTDNLEADDTSSTKRWGGFFKTPKGSEAVSTQLHLVVEEPEEESSTCAENIEATTQAVDESVAQVESDSCLGLPKNRYLPAYADEESKETTSYSSRSSLTKKEKEIDNTTLSKEKQIEQHEDKSSIVGSDEHNSINSNGHKTEPVGKTPRRAGVDVEENLNRGTKKEQIPEVFVAKSQSNDVSDETEHTTVETSRETTPVEDEKHSTGKFASDEISAAVSEGSKSKIFGRVVGMVEQTKRKPLVPITIVEEKFVVDKDVKKISSKVQHLSKLTATQRAKVTSQLQNSSGKPSYDVVGDSNTVICQAISHGNLMANESNEEGDDVVPLNYLTVMLKKKIKEERKKTSDPIPASEMLEYRRQNQESFERRDADSFVAAIRGPRNKEAPGVALEDVATRIHPSVPDPTIGEDTSKVQMDLAPTPRRPVKKESFEEEEESVEGTVEEPVNAEEDEEVEKQRQKMITERLFQAGKPCVEEDKLTKEGDTAVKMVPTVESSESYEDELETEEAKNKNFAEVEKQDPRSGRRMRLALPFLKAGKRK